MVWDVGDDDDVMGIEKMCECVGRCVMERFVWCVSVLVVCVLVIGVSVSVWVMSDGETSAANVGASERDGAFWSE